MSLQIRQAKAEDYAEVEKMVIDSFEPVTWAKALDQKFGILNGLDWKARWRLRLQKIFAEQIVLVGEIQDVITAMSSSSVDQQTGWAYIELLAVACGKQHHGYGREMLRATIWHVQECGARYVHLDCLAGNDKANALYEAEGFEEVARHIRWFRPI